MKERGLLSQSPKGGLARSRGGEKSLSTLGRTSVAKTGMREEKKREGGREENSILAERGRRDHGDDSERSSLSDLRKGKISIAQGAARKRI